MKKLCLLVFGLVLLLPTVGHAGFSLNNAAECAVDNDGTDWFWFCGEQSRSCRGINQNGSEHYVVLGDASGLSAAPTGDNLCQGDPKGCHNDSHKCFYWEQEFYACCGGGPHKTGTLKRYYSGKWLTQKKKKFTNGYCLHYVNPCGTGFKDAEGNEKGDCGDEPTACDDGYALRRAKVYREGVERTENRCVTPCVGGQAFDGEFSDVCIDCPVTKTQGIDNYNTCVKCAADEFFRTGTNCTGSDCCVKKSNVPAASQQALSWCWRCPMGNKSIWRNCLEGGILQECGLTKAIPNDLKVNLNNDGEPGTLLPPVD